MALTLSLIAPFFAERFDYSESISSGHARCQLARLFEYRVSFPSRFLASTPRIRDVRIRRRRAGGRMCDPSNGGQIGRFKLRRSAEENGSAFIQNHYTNVRRGLLDIDLVRFVLHRAVAGEVRDLVKLLCYVQGRDVMNVARANYQIQHNARVDRIESGGRLIEEHDLGPSDEGSGELETPSHAYRKFFWKFVDLFFQTNEAEYLAHRALLILLGPLVFIQAICRVLEDGHSSEQRLFLEDHAHRCASKGQQFGFIESANFAALDQNFSVISEVQPRSYSEQHGLPGTGDAGYAN